MKQGALIAFILTVSVIAVFLLQRVGNKPQSQTDNSVYPLSSASASSDPSMLVMTDWKTHSSALFNYSFSYPPNWFFSSYDEENPVVVAGSHTLTNYDPNAVIKFMDHGLVNWQEFLGNMIAVKVDLSVRKLDQMTKDEYLDKYFGEAVFRPKPDLSIGDLETIQYNTTNTLSDQLVRSFVAFTADGRVATAYIYILYQPELMILQESTQWQELTSVFKTFKFE